MQYILFFLISIHSIHYIVIAGADYTEGTVYLKDGKTRLVLGKLDKAGAAFGYINDTLMQTGWNTLEVKAGYGSQIGNNDVMFAAGYLEGALTAKQIWQHYQNMKSYFFKDKEKSMRDKLGDFFKKQDMWTRRNIKKYASKDAYWRHVSYIMSHIDGLYAGYKQAAQKNWDHDVFVVQFLNAVGDTIDLMHAFSPGTRPNYRNMSRANALRYLHEQGHCTALVKVLGAYENVYLSHSSWFTYSATLRIYKHYDFNVKDVATAAKRMSFSSYPGFLESLDDFYLLGSKMVLLQTTNNIFNTSLYNLVKPESLLAWQRVRVSNMMAHSGPEWAKILQKYNSGTYNNQYMVIDLKKFVLRKTIKDDALWVVEQVPGYVEAGDQTAILRTGYWPSYNVPFFEKIYNKSGYPEFVKTHGLDYSYQLAPRANIFRRDSDKVTDMKSMMSIMRYNDYKHDPYSEGDSCNTICCRGDLERENPRPSGCYDSKVTDFKMALQYQAFALNGPTLGTNLTPFSWTGKFLDNPHVGLPNVYQFGWQYMSPKLS